MQELIQVVTTFDKRRDAEHVARQLVERRLAACVQITGPLTSVYRWNEAIETADEWLCAVKTQRSLYSELQSAIHAMHPYDEPEIVALPVLEASAGYHGWVVSQTTRES